MPEVFKNFAMSANAGSAPARVEFTKTFGQSDSIVRFITDGKARGNIAYEIGDTGETERPIVKIVAIYNTLSCGTDRKNATVDTIKEGKEWLLACYIADLNDTMAFARTELTGLRA